MKLRSFDENSRINSHFHTMNVELYPPEVFFGRLGIPKWLVMGLADAARNAKPMVKLIDIAADFVGGHDVRLVETLKIFNSNTSEILQMSLDGMKAAGITHATPLMLDLAPACESHYTQLPFQMQVDYYGSMYEKSEGKLLPFAMIDPRREHFKEWVVELWEKRDFFGFKAYPPLGVDYNVDSGFNEDWVNDNVAFFLWYCEKHRIPVTTHCSPGGIKGKDMTDKQVHQITCPNNWRPVLDKHPKLFLNLAHFGGNAHFTRHFLGNGGKDNWTTQIVSILETREFYNNVCADNSYHENVIRHPAMYREAILAALTNMFVGDRFLYGDDVDIASIIYSMATYATATRKAIGDDKYSVLANYNPRGFHGGNFDE